MGLSKVKRGCQIEKRKKKLQTEKRGVKQQKQNQKKKKALPTSISRGSACGLGSSSPFALLSFTPCSSPPFTPWVVAVGCCVQRVTRGCCRGWLQGSWLGSEVALCVGASRGCSCVLKPTTTQLLLLLFSVSLLVQDASF